MGFYYGSSSPPPEEEKGSFKDAMLVTLAIFKLLAVPLGVMAGGVAAIVGLFFLFALSPLAGFAAIAVAVAAVGGFAVWEWRHPPRLEG